MIDMQNSSDHRKIAIDQVGVSALKYPIVVLDKNNETQQTVGTFSMSVSLPQEFKGTHMSRFVEILNDHRGEVTIAKMPVMLHAMQQRLEAVAARVEVKFPYFLERSAPVSEQKGLMDYECWFTGEVDGEKDDFVLGVSIPVTSLCPCSKAISDYGAHNQRGYISIEVRTGTTDGSPEMIWIEEVINLAESCASAPVYPLLKRSDERFVTMQAYDNPVFVEDMVRNVAAKLQADTRVQWFKVHAENHESIHNHSAFAEIAWTRPTA